MIASAAGQILCGSEGRVHVRIRGEMHYIIPEELGYLFFVGAWVPLMKRPASPHESPTVVGNVCISATGRAVIIAVGNQRYMLPRDRFLAVALGEDVSCIFFEVPEEETEIERVSLRRGGAAL